MVSKVDLCNTCVYIHTRSDNVVFYVGAGTEERAHSPSGRNLRWRNTVANHAYTVTLVHTGLTRTKAAEIEAELIANYRILSGDALCNLSAGPGMLGLNHTQEAKDKVSAFSREKKLSPKHKAALLAANVGKKRSDEAKAKMAEAKIGKKRSQESVEKTRVGNTGKKRSPDFGDAIRGRMLGTKASPETREKMRTLRNSPEYREKMRVIWDSQEFKDKSRKVKEI